MLLRRNLGRVFRRDELSRGALQMLQWLAMRGHFIALCTVFLAMGPLASAQQAPNTLTPEEEAAGWKLLFDGRTMEGWDAPAKNPPGDSWIIEDGCLRAVSGARIREDILTAETFGDFELVFDWRISAAGNSGVKYRIQDQAVLQPGRENPDSRQFEDRVEYELRNRLGNRSDFDPSTGGEIYEIGFEFQVVDAAHPDAQRGPERTAGALYGIAAPTEPAARPAGEFNHTRIVLRGDHVEHWLNGVQVLEFDLSSPEVAEGLESRWGRESRVFELLTEQPRRQCPIGLQYHGDDAWYRNIKIRPL